MLNTITGKKLLQAERVLRTSEKKTGQILLKLLDAAKHNAKEAKKLDIDTLKISAGWVNMGRTLKRYMPRAQGRATPIRKKSAHVTIVLSDSQD